MGLLRRGREPDPSDEPDRTRAAGPAGTTPAAEPTATADVVPATEPTPAEELATLSEEFEQPTAAEQRRGVRTATDLVRRVSGVLRRGGLATAKGAGVGGKALADRLLLIAPRIPVRDLATLRAQHPEAGGPEELADILARGALRASAAVGASIGAAAMLPVPPAMAVELAAETLVVAALEIKLIAELHQVYGLPPSGSPAQRSGAYVTAWADRRGIDARALANPAGVVALAGLAVGAEVRSKVRRRLTRSTLRKLPSMTPLMVGAGFGAALNRRDTGKLAGRVRADLRARTDVPPGYWEAAAPAGPDAPKRPGPAGPK